MKNAFIPPRKFLMPLSSHSSIGNHCSEFYPHRLILPVLQLHINGIIQHVLFCVWIISLGIMFLRLTHVIAHINSSRLFSAKYSSTE